MKLCQYFIPITKPNGRAYTLSCEYTHWQGRQLATQSDLRQVLSECYRSLSKWSVVEHWRSHFHRLTFSCWMLAAWASYIADINDLFTLFSFFRFSPIGPVILSLSFSLPSSSCGSIRLFGKILGWSCEKNKLDCSCQSCRRSITQHWTDCFALVSSMREIKSEDDFTVRCDEFSGSRLYNKIKKLKIFATQQISPFGIFLSY